MRKGDGELSLVIQLPHQIKTQDTEAYLGPTEQIRQKGIQWSGGQRGEKGRKQERGETRGWDRMRMYRMGNTRAIGGCSGPLPSLCSHASDVHSNRTESALSVNKDDPEPTESTEG